MICPVCGKGSSREWKHCCKDHLIICSSCCKECEYFNRTSTMGGLMCRYNSDNSVEINLLKQKIRRTRALIETQKNLGWSTEESEAQLGKMLRRLKELRGE